MPQSPDLFEGTLRENIDPAGVYSDADIWIALEQVWIDTNSMIKCLIVAQKPNFVFQQAYLKDYVESLAEKLDASVREGGSSLSAGQKQLLCFARALLRKVCFFFEKV